MKTRKPVSPSRRQQQPGRIRWAVVGQGYFAQAAILPAFRHARGSSELVALFSDDHKKRESLARKYKVAFALPYEEYDDFLRSGEVQAVYIALPNHLHKDYTVRAARAGVHVLCEKPMAVTPAECREMIEACEEGRVKLMIAYRLHLEQANLTAIDDIRRGRIGRPRYFDSAFSFVLDEDNVRAEPTERGGGPLYDIGTYCINAARYLFQAEPTEVMAMTGAPARGPRKSTFAEIEEQAAAVLRFPDDRLASFVVSFGAADVARYTVAGDKGCITLEPAFSHSSPIKMVRETPRGSHKQTFRKTDQVAAELSYFADCIQRDREPEPNGWEGYHDVSIITAILESARTGQLVELSLEDRRERPSGRMAHHKPAPRGKASLVHAQPPRD
jgi:predicted dehydrogenase